MALKSVAIQVKEFTNNGIRISVGKDNQIDIKKPENTYWETYKKEDIITHLMKENSFLNISKYDWIDMLNVKFD